MEILAQEAGVSNPLIYKYFDTRLQLLQELLLREYAVFSDTVKEKLTRSEDYRQAVHVYVDINFKQFARGDVLSILFNQPDVRQALQEKERPRYAPFFIKEMAKEYNIATRQAEMLVVLASGASLAAAENCGRYGGNREAQIDQTVEFIFGGIHKLMNGTE